jgi:hypothetical protein
MNCCCTPVVSVGTCLFTKALLSNGYIYLLIKNLLPNSRVLSLFVSRSLASNEPALYTAPSLRLFVTYSLQVYRHFFFSKGCACDVCDQSHLSPSWLGSHIDHSPTTPYLRLFIPSSSLIRCQSIQGYYHHPSFGPVQAKVPRVVNAPTFMALKLLLVVSSFVPEGADPSTMSSHSFSPV